MTNLRRSRESVAHLWRLATPKHWTPPMIPPAPLKTRPGALGRTLDDLTTKRVAFLAK